MGLGYLFHFLNGSCLSISDSQDPNLNVNIPDVFASAPNDDFRK